MIISASDAQVEPVAVVIELLDADSAPLAVLCVIFYWDVADIADHVVDLVKPAKANK